MDRSIDCVKSQQLVKLDEGMSALKPWAQLVCTSDFTEPLIPIRRDQFTIGRSKCCNLSIPDNRLISGQHCILTKNADGNVVLRDTSTNGTIINPASNKIKVSKGTVYNLKHGDEIYLVFKKANHFQNIAYMFQELRQLLDETLVTDDQESDEEETQDYELKKEESEARPSALAPKRPVTSPDCVHVEALQAKRQRVDSQSDEGSQFSAQRRSEVTSTKRRLVAHAEETTDPPGNGTALAASAGAVDTPEGAESPASGEPASSAAVCCPEVVKEPESSKATTSAAVDVPAGGGTEGPSGEGIADNLICIICQDIFHDCISLQPCLHSFCASCYSSWMNKSNNCPSCRMEVQRLSRNFMVNSLVEAFLKEHPNRKRSDEEIANMNAKNQITRDMMVLPNKSGHGYGLSSTSDEEDDEDNSCLSSSTYSYHYGQHFQFGQWLNIGGQFAGRHRGGSSRCVTASICVQCPGYTGPGLDVGVRLNQPTTKSQNVQSAASSSTMTSQQATSSGSAPDAKPAACTTAHSTSDQPSTSSGCAGNTAPPSSTCRGYRTSTSSETIAMPIIPQYVCTPAANHLMCGCCRRQMPDRRQDFYANPQTIPAQKCDVCGNFFCHLYWGCNKPDCNGCLNKFQDLHFGKKCLNNLIQKNSYESEILKNYLTSKSLTWKHVLTSCMSKLDSGQYSCQDGAINRISSSNALCYPCGLRNFQQLAYQYRRDIPRDELPSEVVARPDCHWGKKCRTQRNKPHHARNFNHICEQTRF